MLHHSIIITQLLSIVVAMNSSPDLPNKLRFKAFSNSWVAIHPKPKGIIQFVGSFFIFGSVPTFFYHSLFKSLYAKNYTIIAYPNSLVPPLIWKLKLVDHWRASIELLREEYAVKTEVIKYLLRLPHPPCIDIYLDQSNYSWLGHSLGCKYISLLEIMSDNSVNFQTKLKECGFTPEELNIIEDDLATIEDERNNTDKNITALLQEKAITTIVSSKSYIKDQSSIFLAPEIYGTAEVNGKPQSAIPLFEVFPSGDKTLCLIGKSRKSFQLMGLIAFNNDNISEDDVKSLKQEFKKISAKFIFKEFPGCDLKIEFLSGLASHLKPVGSDIEPLGESIDKTYQELKNRLSKSDERQEVG